MEPTVNLIQALQGKRLLIFDFDGTVADTSPMHAAAFTEVLAGLGIVVDYPRIAGMKTLDAMHKCLALANCSLSDNQLTTLVAAKQQRARQMIGEGLQPLPGMDEFLRWARTRYRLAMVTSGSRDTVSLALAKLGYTDWFSPLICAEDVRYAKPSPEGFIAVLNITGVFASQALVFEDSEAGLSAAALVGIDFVDVTEDLIQIAIRSKSYFKRMKA